MKSHFRAHAMVPIRRLGTAKFFLLFLFLALNVQVSLVKALGWELKLYHLLLPAFFPVALYIRAKWREILFFSPFVISVLISTLLSFAAGNVEGAKLFPNYAFAFLSFLVAYRFAMILAPNSQMESLKIASWLILFASVVKLLLTWSQIREYLSNPYAHPEIFWFYGGGPNIEATFLVMNAAFHRRTKMFWFFWGLSLGISIIYASRVAIVLAVFLALTQILSQRSLKPLLLGGLALLVSGVLTYYLNPYAFERFGQIGEEVGSVTRLEMWSGGMEVLTRSTPYSILFGYGPGSAIQMVEDVTGRDFLEDNVHNYFLQVLLDFGLLGLLSWLLICIYITRNAGLLKGDEWGTYVFLYLIASLFQFRGAEPLFWFVLGLFVAKKAMLRTGDYGY